MDNNPLVSIIVPVYKAEKYLDECISSLVKQTYADLEIILVDDGSPDNSLNIIDAWAKKDARIKVIHKDNEGVSATRNIGIDCASGEYILFVDADDYVSVRLVEILMSHRTHDRSPACGIIRFTESPITCDDERDGHIVKSDDLANCRNGLFAVGILYDRSVVEKLHLRFDSEIGNLEDSVWNCEYLCYMPDVTYIDRPLYYYRVNPASITSGCRDRKWQISCWLKARKSMMNWLSEQIRSIALRKHSAKTFRYCQNNIYAECVAGNITYTELHSMECDPSAQFDQSLVSAPERFVMNHFPKLYYGIYTLLLRAKYAIHK